MIRRLLATALLLLATAPAHADSPAIDEIRLAWAACTEHLAAQPDNWFGWRRVHDGGYADIFEFWDQGSDGYGPSVLKRKYLIDAIASEVQTFCYRPDGRLAFVFIQMTSPDIASDGPALTREGRIYMTPKGEIIRVLGKIVGDGFETNLDDPAHQLARGCWQLDLIHTRDEVHTAYLAEMGDIDGSKPTYMRHDFDWCSEVE